MGARHPGQDKERTRVGPLRALSSKQQVAAGPAAYSSPAQSPSLSSGTFFGKHMSSALRLFISRRPNLKCSRCCAAMAVTENLPGRVSPAQVPRDTLPKASSQWGSGKGRDPHENWMRVAIADDCSRSRGSSLIGNAAPAARFTGQNARRLSQLKLEKVAYSWRSSGPWSLASWKRCE